MAVDFYNILQIDKDATPDDIKKAYRRLALKFHPDNYKGDKQEAEIKFKEINEAYKVLSDPVKKRQYDTRSFGGFSLRDFFGDFNNFRTNYVDTSPKRGMDIKIILGIDLVDIVKDGSSKSIEYEVLEPCNTCSGSGFNNDCSEKTGKCTECNGMGQKQRAINNNFFFSVGCHVCGGIGKVVREEAKCFNCNGIGVIKTNHTVTVNIPLGARTEDIVFLRYMGHAGKNGGPKGDLYVILRVEENTDFLRQENDLFKEINLSIPEAVLGCKKEINTIYGNSICAEIPAGICDGQYVIINHYGCPIPRSIIKEKGDLILVAKIVIPGNTTEEQKAIYAKLLELEKNHGKEERKQDGETGKTVQDRSKSSAVSQGDEVFARS